MSEFEVDFDEFNPNAKWRRLFPSAQITATYDSGDYLDDVDLTGLTTSSGLVPFTRLPSEIRKCLPAVALPAVRPVITAIGYKIVTGVQQHTIVVDLVGRQTGESPALVPLVSQIPLFDARARFFSGFNIPVPVDTEAGHSPFHLRIVTAGKNGISIVTVNYQWDLVSYQGNPGTE